MEKMGRNCRHLVVYFDRDGFAFWGGESVDELHPLLRQQLDSCFGRRAVIPPRWRKFIDMVNKAYFELGVGPGCQWESLRLERRKLLKENAEMLALIRAFPDVFFWVD